ncbi:MAG: hypothetical protein OXC00_03950 [Acidimicrobiaceae bacterium]|nr:hypothetical protein [Acidimicrobiaceae bacterium]
MDPAIAATLVAVMVSALLGVFAGAFHLLRSDLKELRAENRADHRDSNARIDRLEGKLDSLILALARAGFLVDPQAPEPPDPQG